jgi:predicted nucleic acid-binding protein
LIVLDTNVLSTMMRGAPEASVIRWLDDQPAESIWITAVTVFEVELGLALLPAGARRRSLERSFAELLLTDLGGRVLDFDRSAAGAAAALGAARQRRGRVVDVRDTQIAGIVVSRRATLATRNARDFADLDVPVVNPWDPPIV